MKFEREEKVHGTREAFKGGPNKLYHESASGTMNFQITMLHTTELYLYVINLITLSPPAHRQELLPLCSTYNNRLIVLMSRSTLFFYMVMIIYYFYEL